MNKLICTIVTLLVLSVNGTHAATVSPEWVKLTVTPPSLEHPHGTWVIERRTAASCEEFLTADSALPYGDGVSYLWDKPLCGKHPNLEAGGENHWLPDGHVSRTLEVDSTHFPPALR